MRASDKTIRLISKLLSETTSIAIVSAFLKDKGLTHSASSWDEMTEKRIIPAIKAKKVAIEELADLLRSAEEHGRQHVFLYNCNKEVALGFMNKTLIIESLHNYGLDKLIDKPKILDQPQSPEIVEIRWDGGNTENPKWLVIKVVETRETSELLSEATKGDILTKKWRIKKERAVNVFRLRADGSLELRIASQKSAKYTPEINKMWKIVEDFLPRKNFNEISLTKAKEYLWENRETLQDLVRYSDITLRDDTGSTIKAATGSPTSDLYENHGINNSMEVFHKHDAYCDSHNIWFKLKNRIDVEKPHEIHVLLSGEINEFAVTRQCSSEEYEYGYDKLQSFNR